MDAFTYFFIELALWNILLATLAFLFGLLMGHWMWGQFKKKLSITEKNLRDSENEISLLTEDAAQLRELNLELGENADTKTDGLATKLKASRLALEEMKLKTKKAKEELSDLKKKGEAQENELKKLSGKLTVLAKEKENALSAKNKAEKESVSSVSAKEDWEEEKGKLTALLKKEKGEAASLREVITGLNENEQSLKKKIGDLQQELKKSGNDSTDD